LELSHPNKVESAVALFYENFWVRWNEPTKPENMQAILGTVLGSDEEAGKVLERVKTEEVKKKLSANTEKAFADGAFGLPWFVGEYSAPFLFCGSPQYLHLAGYLQAGPVALRKSVCVFVY
jgi:2-hydroxychromene-2-carboxylate isomerase